MKSAPQTAWQFTLFRIVFGIYLAIHFAMLIPYASELFGHDGLIKNSALNPAAGLFPNPLDRQLPHATLQAIIGGLAVLSLFVAAGIWRPVASLLLWFGWTALFHRNNLIANPSIPYVGLLLVLCTLVPSGEPLSFHKRNENWEMPAWVFRCAWILLAAGYTFSGITKLSSPSWVDGSAIHYLLENPLARPGIFRDAMLGLPAPSLKILTWFTLGAELLFLPLAGWKKSRPWIWLTLVFLHLGIIMVVDFADLSLGMLMIHAFTFDRRWLPSPFYQAIVAYDGECMMCSRAIRLIAGEDVGRRIRFVPLQSPEGRSMEAAAGIADLTGMVVDAGGKISAKSGAMLAILSALGGHWRLLALITRPIPRKLRDRLYDFITANRYRWFGKTTLCRIPSRQVRERIL